MKPIEAILNSWCDNCKEIKDEERGDWYACKKTYTGWSGENKCNEPCLESDYKDCIYRDSKCLNQV